MRTDVEMKDKCFVISDTAVNESSKDQPLTTLYDITELTIADGPKTDEEVLHRNTETSTKE